MFRTDDTIVALATPVGEGAIAVVRLSGAQAFAIAGTIARLGAAPASHRAVLRTLRDGDDVLDQALVIPFVGPASATGEDVVELHCHGGRVTPRRVVDALVRAGARPAEPGEFTRRALARGRLDLLQVEAIADVIHAQSEAGHRLAQQHLAGELSAYIDAAKAQLVELLTLVEAAIDFADEEDVDVIAPAEVARRAVDVIGALDALLGTWNTGRLRHDGVRVAIVGAPNAGKSTLLNHLLGHDRALVTDVPGTTRDWLEEGWSLDGQLFRLVDTAGLRDTVDRVEALGVERARQIVDEADVAVVVVDATAPALDAALVEALRGRPWALVCNKCDLAAPAAADLGRGAVGRVDLSLRTGVGCDGLDDMLRALASAAGIADGEGGVAITRARHHVELLTAREALETAREGATIGVEHELMALDLRAALDALGRLTGAVTSDDVLRRILSDFCIGK